MNMLFCLKMKTVRSRPAQIPGRENSESEIRAFFDEGDGQIAARRKLASALERAVAEMYSPEMVMHVNRVVRNMLSVLPMTEARALEAGESLAAIVEEIKMPRRAPSKEWLAFSESFVMMRHLAAMENAAHNPLLFTRYRTAGPLDWLKSAGKSVVTSEWFEYTTGFARRCNSRSKSYVSQSYLDMKKKLSKIREIGSEDSPEKFRMVSEFAGNWPNDLYEQNIDAYSSNYKPRNKLEYSDTNLNSLRAEFKARRRNLKQRVEGMEKFLRDWSESGRPRTTGGDEITLSKLAENDKGWLSGNVLRMTEFIDAIYSERNAEMPSVNQNDTGARKFAAVALYLIGGAAFAGAMASVQQQSFHTQLYNASKDIAQLTEMTRQYTAFSGNFVDVIDEARAQMAEANLSFPEFYLAMREMGVTDMDSYNQRIDKILLGVNPDVLVVADDVETAAKEVETIGETEKRMNLPYIDENRLYAARSGDIIENVAVPVAPPRFRELVPRLEPAAVLRFAAIAKTDPAVRAKNAKFEREIQALHRSIFDSIEARLNVAQDKLESLKTGQLFKNSISTSRGYAILMAEILKKHSPTLFMLDAAAKYLGGPEKINTVDLFFRSSQFENVTFEGAAPQEISASPTIANMFGWAGWASNKMRAAAMAPGRWFMDEAESEFHENISSNMSMFDDVASSALFLLNLRQIGITGYTSIGLTALNQLFLATTTDVRIAIFWALVLFGGGRAAKSVLNAIRRAPGGRIGDRDLSLVSRLVDYFSPAAADALETIWQGTIVLLSPLSFGVLLGMRLCDTYNVLANTWPAIQIAMSTASVIMPATVVTAGSIGAFVFALRYYHRKAGNRRAAQLDGIVSGVARVLKQRPDLTLYGVQSLCMMVQFGFTAIADKNIEDVLKMIYEGKDAIIEPVFSAKNSVMAMLFMMGMAATHGFVDMRPRLHRIFGDEVSPYLTVTSPGDADAAKLRHIHKFLGLVVQYFHGEVPNPDYVASRLLSN